MSTTIFLAPHRALDVLMTGGIDKDSAIAHLVRLKDSEFAQRFDGTTYFDPAELNRIVAGA